MRRILLFLILVLLFARIAYAQTGGQFCVRAFEDRNGSGTLDAGEPLLTSGVSADLLNAENVIVASALLSESPTAAQGVICFQFLAPGQYSMILTSPDYAPTTPNTVTAAISEGTLPTVVEFGGQRLTVEPVQASAGQSNSLVANLTGLANLERDLLPRLVLSVLGALLVMAGMVVLGSLIYLLFLRRPPAAVYYPAVTASTSGKLEPVDAKDSTKPV